MWQNGTHQLHPDTILTLLSHSPTLITQHSVIHNQLLLIKYLPAIAMSFAISFRGMTHGLGKTDLKYTELIYYHLTQHCKQHLANQIKMDLYKLTLT
jgi:hypothetical protein